MDEGELVTIQELAKFMHDEYEKAAKFCGWETQEKTKVEYEELPKENKEVMLIVAEKVICRLRARLSKDE